MTELTRLLRYLVFPLLNCSGRMVGGRIADCRQSHRICPKRRCYAVIER